ncbi:MAG: hypothetical protein J5I92_15105 [Thiogranum sp.]|nr:hypothetical protein [Thiogranum sp.]
MLRPILEALLRGEFLCPISQSALYRELEKPETQNAVEAVLEPLGRRLARVEEDGAFYCAYRQLDDKKDARAVRAQFEKLRDQIAPVVELFTLLMRSEGRDAVWVPGEALRFSGLLERIEQESAYQGQLRQLGRHELFKRLRNQSKTADRLTSVLEAMEKEGYLVLSNHESGIYQVTGKIEYFYTTLEFIQEFEQIPLEDEDRPQQELTL